MPYLIRPARVDDAGELLAIYAPFVTDTTVSFETEVPSVEEFRARRAGPLLVRLPRRRRRADRIDRGVRVLWAVPLAPGICLVCRVIDLPRSGASGQRPGRDASRRARGAHEGSRRPHEHRVHHLEQQRVHRVSREAWVPRLRHPCRLWLQTRQLARYHVDGKAHHAGRCGAATPRPTLPKLRIGRERHHRPHERSWPMRRPRSDSDHPPAATGTSRA